MKKKGLTIREFQYADSYYSITLCNAGLNPDVFGRLKIIIKLLAEGSDFFFGHYKLDGINISHKRFVEYGLEIPSYFVANGMYQTIVKASQNPKRKVFSPKELIVCRAPNNIQTYEIIDKVFHYYLETVVFCPKVDWKTFVNAYSNYMDNGTKDYIRNGYADIVFSYVDSGDFSVSFDPTVYDPRVVRKKIDQVLGGKGDGSVIPLETK